MNDPCKQKNILCSWIKSLSFVKTSIGSKESILDSLFYKVYIFNAVQIPKGISKKLKADSKIYIYENANYLELSEHS
jgi:hypothetical protein